MTTTQPGTPPETGQPAPFLRVARGRPTDAEVAALVVALSSRRGGEAPPAPAPSPWGDPARRVRSWGRLGGSARG